MTYIDDVLTQLDQLTEAKRALWSANAARVLAQGPHRKRLYADALRLSHTIAALEAVRTAEDALIVACGLDWDRAVKDRTAFRGFDGDHLVTRARPGKFIVQVRGAALPRPYTTLCAARAAAAEAFFAGAEDDAPAALPRAA